jgi:hypothetical protein
VFVVEKFIGKICLVIVLSVIKRFCLFVIVVVNKENTLLNHLLNILIWSENMDLNDKTIEELKSLAYDELRKLELCKNNLHFLNQKIAEKEQEKVE